MERILTFLLNFGLCIFAAAWIVLIVGSTVEIPMVAFVVTFPAFFVVYCLKAALKGEARKRVEELSR